MGLSIHPTTAFAIHFVSSLGKEVEREEVKTLCKHKRTNVPMKQHKHHKCMNRYIRSIEANYRALKLRS